MANKSQKISACFKILRNMILEVKTQIIYSVIYTYILPIFTYIISV